MMNKIYKKITVLALLCALLGSNSMRPSAISMMQPLSVLVPQNIPTASFAPLLLALTPLCLRLIYDGVSIYRNQQVTPSASNFALVPQNNSTRQQAQGGPDTSTAPQGSTQQQAQGRPAASTIPDDKIDWGKIIPELKGLKAARAALVPAAASIGQQILNTIRVTNPGIQPIKITVDAPRGTYSRLVPPGKHSIPIYSEINSIAIEGQNKIITSATIKNGTNEISRSLTYLCKKLASFHQFITLDFSNGCLSLDVTRQTAIIDSINNDIADEGLAYLYSL